MERTTPDGPTESVADAVRVLVVDDEPAIADQDEHHHERQEVEDPPPSTMVLDARSLPWSVRLTHRPTSSSRISVQVQQSNLGSG